MEKNTELYDWAEEPDTNATGRKKLCDWEGLEDNAVVHAPSRRIEETELAGRRQNHQNSSAQLVSQPEWQRIEPEEDWQIGEMYTGTSIIDSPGVIGLSAISEKIHPQRIERYKTQLAGLAVAGIGAYLLVRWGYEVYESDQQLLEAIRQKAHANPHLELLSKQ